MICNIINDEYFIVKLLKDYCAFDIYDHEEIKNLVQDIFDTFLKKYNIYGSLVFNVFFDQKYGIIVEVKKERDLNFNHLVDIKIKFHLNISFLYEIDYFYLLDNNIINQNIYFYNDKFYLEIVNDINDSDYIKLLDNSKIIYDNEMDKIVNNGIKLDKNVI